jgi:CP family cyanate transporter-like MFS transporter
MADDQACHAPAALAPSRVLHYSGRTWRTRLIPGPGTISMNAPPAEARPLPAGRLLLCVILLWSAGIGLRVTILAVPPLIRLIHDDLALSETEVGILTALPTVVFGLAAVPGAVLIARFGTVAAVIAGLLATALGGALRGVAPDFVALCAATVLTGAGVAVMQPAMPPLVRAWLPDRIGFGTAVYTNGLLIGEIIPVAMTIPLVLPFADHSWRLAFAVWALPAIVFALMFIGLAPPAGRVKAPESPGRAAAPLRWAPDWKSGLIWRLGVMLGATNATYFSTNAFIPDYLHHLGRPDLIGPALSALNIGQLPASFLLLFYAGRLTGRVWPFAACGALSLVCIPGLLAGSGFVIVAAAAAIGFSGAASLILALTLPPLLSAPGETHRMTAGILTISYSCGVIVPVVSGLAWDASGVPAAAFIPIGLCNFLLIGLAPAIRAPLRAAAAG